MVKVFPVSRACNGCTACCEGHLTGEAYGSKFYPGRRCVFATKKGCSIYEYRPRDPCVGFECAYKTMYSLPEWTRPDLSNVIFVLRQHEGIDYLHGSHTGKTPVSKIFEWAPGFAKEKKIHIMIPREPFKKELPPYKISVYGPDDSLKQAFASLAGNEIID